jgi:hypothetical protein
MEAANMSFEEEALKSRIELRRLRQENARITRSNEILRLKKVLLLEKENLELKKKNKLLQKNQSILNETVLLQKKQIESLQLIVEELRKMIFGKKKGEDNSGKDQKDSTDTNAQAQLAIKKRKPAQRANESYRRATPTEDEVTDMITHPLTHCADCGTLLTKLKHVIRYTEDLVNLTELSKLLKRIEKHIIGTGFCGKCKRRKTAHPVSPQASVLGENIKQFICYLSIVMRLSFAQIRCFLADTADFHLSTGEITACLDQQAKKLTHEKDRLLQKIRGAPSSHYDETGWNTRGGLGNYAWIKRATEGTDTVFLMGRSRGKGVALELQGTVDNQVGISDDYGAYTNMFKIHQLCMAHPNRKLRDLAESKTLSEKARTPCDTSYQLFRSLYADLEQTLSTEYDKELWLKKRGEYINRIKEVAIITANDPQKLKAVKDGLKRNAEKYFTCLTQPGIPADNNKAERGLRHIVLKRKISYGSKSQNGANTMGILCSTLLSAWWRKPKNFFTAYKQMLAPVIAA